MRVFELNDFANRFNYFNDIFGTDEAMPYYDKVDITNAVSYTYHRKDTINDDIQREWRLGELLNELRWMGAPDDCNIKDFVANNWFESMRIWTEIQRDIHLFNIAFRGRRDKPKISNFSIVPMCSFQRRHIRIDTHALYTILCKVGIVSKKIGKRKLKDGTIEEVNISQSEFSANPIRTWNLYFDMQKILEFVHNKKQFHYQIMTDGVSATILYNKPEEQQERITNEDLLQQYRAGLFVYELGIDPGMRTWNATVRRNIQTGEEVIFICQCLCKLIF